MLLECGHWMHETCINGGAVGILRAFFSSPRPRLKECPDCGHALPAQLLDARVLVPEGSSPTFDFCLKRKIWSINRENYTPGSVLDVRLDTGPNGIIVPPVCNLKLKDVLRRHMRGKVAVFCDFVFPRTATIFSRCPECGDESANIPSGNVFYGIIVTDECDGLRVEKLIHNQLQATGMCYSCTGHMNFFKGQSQWIYNRQTCIWHSVSETKNPPVISQLQLLTLPPIWRIKVTRCNFELTINYSRIIMPMVLDGSSFFSPECPVPTGACVLYDLCFFVEIMPVSENGQYSRYISFMKSSADNRWYQADVCEAPEAIPGLDAASSVASHCVTSMLYLRRDVSVAFGLKAAPSHGPEYDVCSAKTFRRNFPWESQRPNET